jgi:osmotically-inducible protein OsmY
MVDPSSHGRLFAPRSSRLRGISHVCRNQISDKDLPKAVSQRLTRSGIGSQSHVSAAVHAGVVTLTGTLQYAIQRSPIVKAATNAAGVRRVLDQMQLTVKKVQ